MTMLGEIPPLDMGVTKGKLRERANEGNMEMFVSLFKERCEMRRKFENLIPLYPILFKP